MAQYHDMRLAGDPDENGKLIPRSNNTVRLELALLSHLFTIAIKEWGLGLPFNPVSQIRRRAPGAGRNRRLTPAENKRLLAAVDAYSNPLFSWIVRIALETGMRLSEIGGLRLDQVEQRYSVPCRVRTNRKRARQTRGAGFRTLFCSKSCCYYAKSLAPSVRDEPTPNWHIKGSRLGLLGVQIRIGIPAFLSKIGKTPKHR